MITSSWKVSVSMLPATSFSLHSKLLHQKNELYSNSYKCYCQKYDDQCRQRSISATEVQQVPSGHVSATFGHAKQEWIFVLLSGSNTSII